MGTALPTTPDYGTALPESGGTALASIIGVLAVYGVIFLIAFAISLVFTIFQGIGLLKMHKTLGLSNGWMSFIPILNYYAIGKIAEQYIKKDGKKSAKFSVILLVGYFGYFIISCILGFILGIVISVFPLSQALMLVLLSLIYIIVFGCAIAYQVLLYVALWRIYAIFSNENATLFLILSIFISFVQPFLIFAIRNNEPCCVEIKEETPIIEEAVEM